MSVGAPFIRRSSLRHRRSHSALFVSQVLASLSSFFYLVLAGHGMPLSSYGLLGVFFALFYFGSGVLRSVTSDLFVPRVRTGRDIATRIYIKTVSRTQTILIVIIAFILPVAFVLMGNISIIVFFALFGSYFMMLSYQAARSGFVALDRMGRVLLTESFALALSLCGASYLLYFDFQSLELWVSLYACSLGLPAILLSVGGDVFGLALPGFRYVLDTWHKTRFFLGDFVLGAGAAQLSIASLGLTLTASDLGSWRILQSELGPQNFLISVVSIVGIVVATSKSASASGVSGRRLLLFTVPVILVFVVYAVSLILMPTSWLQEIFGPYAKAGDIPYLALTAAGCAFIVEASLVVYMRVQERGREMLLARLWSLPILATVPLGALWFGLTGASVGFCCYAFALAMSYALRARS